MKYFIILIMIILNIQKVYSEPSELQFFGTNGAIVITEGAILYKEPNIDSGLIEILPFLQDVAIITKTNINYSGTNQIWYYVDSRRIPHEAKMIKTERGWEYPTLKGWVQREDLAGWGDFKPVKKIQEMFITCHEVDGPPVYYRIYSNGTYKIRTEEKFYYSELVRIHLTGNIYRYRNVILLTGKTGEVANLFYYDDEEQLKGGSTWETEVLTDKSKFPKWAQSDKAPVLETYYILTGDNVNVRTKASTNSAVLFKLKKGTRVKFLERTEITIIGDRTGYWVYIDTGVKDKEGNTIKGWVLDLYLSPEIYYILTGDNVNVRSEASTNSAVLLKLKKGARVKLLERSDVTFTIGDRTGNWVYIDTGVKDKKGKPIKGWMVDIYLDEEE
ncbi:SH3 domain-containing protein [Thermospira aquatica]|uniref:SH3 domain-containing protein n=1 Tax=Thermospira aquatica TaxID=2828656 RepID=A0AAX3BER3_9SPIR|nr:SH3 domain-containing protein [Thermospira aquatica]URA10630.1 SH3 domain-containing protein [Thermospira aquatica]